METYSHETQFGRYAVVGDPSQSIVFAPNDATLVLLSLRFDPYRPIKNIGKIGYSIRSPRRLSEFDVQLLEKYAEVPDRWRVFISYQSSDRELAERLSNTLRLMGLNVFRDKDSLRGGAEWWPDIERAIKRSRYFVVLLGEKTHRSTWVQRELRIAMDHNIAIIPVFAGADTENWRTNSDLLNLHALSIQPDKWSLFIKQLLRAIGSPITSFDQKEDFVINQN